MPCCNTDFHGQSAGAGRGAARALHRLFSAPPIQVSCPYGLTKGDEDFLEGIALVPYWAFGGGADARRHQDDPRHGVPAPRN